MSYERKFKLPREGSQARRVFDLCTSQPGAFTYEQLIKATNVSYTALRDIIARYDLPIQSSQNSAFDEQGIYEFIVNNPLLTAEEIAKELRTTAQRVTMVAERNGLVLYRKKHFQLAEKLEKQSRIRSQLKHQRANQGKMKCRPIRK